MKKSDLKRIIKPMVAECIKESLLEAGILSTVISEVVKGMNTQLMTEQHQVQRVPQEAPRKETSSEEEEKLQETKKLMLKAIGSDAYGGVNLFEGTTPAAPQKQNSHGPLRDSDPNDSGVDISGIFNNNWSKLV
jgi:hypothetical protein